MKIYFFSKTKQLGDSPENSLMIERTIAENPKRLIGFVILQLYYYKNTTYEIVKHDTAHGIYNIHKFYENKQSKEEFPNEPITTELFQRIKTEVLNNWQDYRDSYVRKWLSGR